MLRMKLFTKAMVLAAVSVMTLSSLAQATELLGAGATFPYPFYAKLTDTYHKKTGVKINYQSIGSGGGIQQLKNKTVDFGASDAFLSDKELKEMPGKVVHIPTCLGGVALSFNVPGVQQLNLSGDIIGQIFLGKIKTWNDPAIAKLNPKAKLPNLAIAVVHRSDGSGTTSIFTEFLAQTNGEWKSKVGAGKSVNWPAGLGGKGNAGVAGLIKQVPGSIGYIEHIYAKQNKMTVAAVQNKKGKFILPTLASVSKAVDEAIPNDTRVSLVNTDAADGYPIASFTWLLVYQDLSALGAEKAKALQNFLAWTLKDGQGLAEGLDYAKLPASAVKKAEKLVKTLKVQ
jgi:phosphate transport system substrate-binding protein